MAVFEEGDEEDASCDVAGGGEAEPSQVTEAGDASVDYGGEDFSAASDAVGEVGETDDEGEGPDDGDGAGNGVAAADEPGHERDDPAAHNAAPEDVVGGMIGGGDSGLRECGEDVGLECSGEHAEGGKEERASDIGCEHNGPESERGENMPALGEDEGDGIEGVFGKELTASEDYGHESQRVEQIGDELRGGGVAELRGNGGDAEAGKAHGEAAYDS